jgi:2,3-bisphosphoglycerate-independent phosphoglycerate mutase
MKSLIYISDLEKEISKIGIGKISSVSGRYWAMDRDRRWERIQKVYDLLTLGIGNIANTPEAAISESYRHNRTDEFIIPTLISSPNSPFVPINSNDSIIYFNFRADRSRQLTRAFTETNFPYFQRKKIIQNCYFATFAFLEEDLQNPNIHPTFSVQEVNNPLAKILSVNNLKQFHLAETEKYAHVTFFFNGGKEKAYFGEERILVPSPKVATYDLKPDMSAPEITLRVLENLGRHAFSVINFANPDMVGHTGNLKSTILACETVDQCLGKIVKDALNKKINVIITADHGNAEQMINPDNGEPFTEHTTNPVPFIIVSNEPQFQRPLRENNHLYKLADVAPTILEIMGIKQPSEMTGKSLLMRN